MFSDVTSRVAQCCGMHRDDEGAVTAVRGPPCRCPASTIASRTTPRRCGLPRWRIQLYGTPARRGGRAGFFLGRDRLVEKGLVGVPRGPGAGPPPPARL